MFSCSLLASHFDYSLKPFWPLLLTFILPRAFGYARALQVAYRTRPSPQPLSGKAGLSLSLLFGAICIFLAASFSVFFNDNVNIFMLTNSRLAIPTDVLSSRLSSVRPGQTLTTVDEQLRKKLTSTALRKLYLRFGPSTLTECPFCTPLDHSTYLLYHFPRNIVLPHLFNFGLLGLATSTTISGTDAGQWRFYALAGSLMIGALDAYYVVTFSPSIDANMPAPPGIFWMLAAIRPLVLCLYNAFVAFFIYASATKRFLLFSGPSKDPAIVQHQMLDIINKCGFTMSSAGTKLRAGNVAHNTIVRAGSLKNAEDRYWQDVVQLEGSQDLQSGVFEDEEVQAAISRAYGSGTINIEKIRKEAETFVKGVTYGLEHTADQSQP